MAHLWVSHALSIDKGGHAITSGVSVGTRWASRWIGVNGGVLAVALLTTAAHDMAKAAFDSRAAAAALSTLVLYVLVFAAASSNLQRKARRRLTDAKRNSSPYRPIACLAIISHPIGSACERFAHETLLAASTPSWPGDDTVPRFLPGGSAEPPLALLISGCAWWLWLAGRLFVFEVLFDLLFYVAHRGVHAHPTLYKRVHKLHHRHTHELWLLSSLQMSPLDVLLTHTLPMLGALCLVPLARCAHARVHACACICECAWMGVCAWVLRGSPYLVLPVGRRLPHTCRQTPSPSLPTTIGYFL